MLLPLYLIVFLGMPVLEGWTFIRCMRLGPQSRVFWVCLGCFVLAGAGSFYTTFYDGERSDRDSRSEGWPVPGVTFHRDRADGSWPDDGGVTDGLAWPINGMLFLLVPCLVLLPRTKRWQKA